MTVDPLALVGIGITVLIWWLVSLQFPPVRLPGPQRVAETAITDFFHDPALEFIGLHGGGFAANLVYTVTNVLIGVTLGMIIGVTIGLVSSRVWVVRDLVNPVLSLIVIIPIVVIGPFLLMWFGTIPEAQVLLVSLYSGTLVAITSQRAGLNLPPHYEAYAASLGADRRRRFWTIIVPASLPAILGGLRVALANAWGIEAIAELLGAPIGVGRVVIIVGNLQDTSAIMAIVLWLSVIAVSFDRILVHGVGWLIRWQEVRQ